MLENIDRFSRECFIKRTQTANGVMTEVFDKETGMKLAGQWDGSMRRPPGRQRDDDGRKPEFFRVYCSNWADIIDRKRLTFQEVGVLMSLMRFIDWESNFLVNPKTKHNLNATEIADLLHSDRATMLDYLDRLAEKGMLATVKLGSGCANHYLLNSHILFKGKNMKDLSQHNRFCKDNTYQAPVPIKYKGSTRTPDEGEEVV